MSDKKRELLFVNKDNGKWYPLDEVKATELADGLEKITKEISKRLALQKEQR